MKIKRWLGSFLAILILVTPISVFASEQGNNTEKPIEVSEAPKIEMLTSEQAEILYKQLYGEIGLEQRSDLGTCDIGLSTSNGRLLVVYSTSCRGIASKIGVRNFTLQHKDGLFWSDIVIRNEYSENTDAFFGGFYVTNPVAGRKYRANCTHYAVKNGQELSMYTETEAFTFE